MFYKLPYLIFGEGAELWGLSAQPGIEPRLSALGVQSPNHVHTLI